jgi:hypothetical protein
MKLAELLKPELENLINESKISLNEVKRVAIGQAWKILQLAVANIIQKIEVLSVNETGKDKKTIAMDLLNNFYDKVFTIIDIPFIPPLIEPLIHKYVKTFLMILVGSTIDAMVTTFRETGVFLQSNSK